MPDEVTQRNIAAAWQSIRTTESGGKIIDWLSSFCGEGRNPYCESNFDKTANKCGKLAVILKVREFLAVDLSKPELKQAKNERYI